MSGWKRNDDNGHPMWHASPRLDGIGPCTFCGTPIVWLRYATTRIPYENDSGFAFRWGACDHRTPCRMRREGRWLGLGPAQHRFATVRAPSARLRRAAGRAGRIPRPWKAMTGRSSRDESVAHVPATQAAGQTTGRAGAQATAPVFPLRAW